MSEDVDFSRCGPRAMNMKVADILRNMTRPSFACKIDATLRTRNHISEDFQLKGRIFIGDFFLNSSSVNI